MTRPFMSGMTCVKLNPESTTRAHSGGCSPSWKNRVPWGIKDPALNEDASIWEWMREERRRTGAAVVGLKLVFFEDELVVGFLDVG
jgi:hypothetical protein